MLPLFKLSITFNTYILDGFFILVLLNEPTHDSNEVVDSSLFFFIEKKEEEKNSNNSVTENILEFYRFEVEQKYRNRSISKQVTYDD